MKKQSRPTGAERLFSKISGEEELSEELVPEEPKDDRDDEPVFEDEEYSR